MLGNFSVSSRMNAMNVEQLLIRVRAIMMDDVGCQVSADTYIGQLRFDEEFPPGKLRSGYLLHVLWV